MIEPEERVADATLHRNQGNGMLMDESNIKPSEERYDKVKVFLRMLPVFFVLLLMVTIYIIYIVDHSIPLIRGKIGADKESQFTRGILQIVVFHVFLALTIINFILAIVISPGKVLNESELHAKLVGDEENDIKTIEVKKSGEKRYCKWCYIYKPDRTHHCRICRQCIIKMDHHCPWIYNCVGWGNHKFFMLLQFYGLIVTGIVAGTMIETIQFTLEKQSLKLGEVVSLLFCEAISIILFIALATFFGFHLYLTFSGMTTIEYYEKSTKAEVVHKVWSRGAYNNFTHIFGKNPFFWFIPIDNREHDGLNFVANECSTNEKMPEIPDLEHVSLLEKNSEKSASLSDILIRNSSGNSNGNDNLDYANSTPVSSFKSDSRQMEDSIK